MNLAFADSYLNAAEALDSNTLKAVQDAIKKLRVGGPKMVNLHALEACDFHAFNVNQNAYRVIACVDGDQIILLHVGPHDPAYKWARRHRMSQVGTTIRLRQVTFDEDTTKSPRSGPGAHVGPTPGPLVDLRDRVFERFDITPGFAAILRGLPDEDAVVEVAEHLKPALGEALLALATDPDAVDAAYRDYVEHRTATPPAVSLEDALKDPKNAHRFWIPPPGEEALARALEGDFEAWRVFLHPSQRRLVQLDARGPVKITGGPGTGKTVVALHRARHLAETVFAEDPRPVLVTAFSKALVEDMAEAFARLCEDAPQLLERVVFRTSTRVAIEVLKASGRDVRFAQDEALRPLWEEAIAEDSLGYGVRFYEQERRDVVARLGAWTEHAYFRARREGRQVRLDRAKRQAVWSVLASFQSKLEASGSGDDIELARAARNAVVESPFAAVVCDELQDMSPEALRLLARLGSGPDGEARPNALSLCGDGYQRIFRSPVPLSACDIDVRGRSHQLRLNYRTTEGIRAAAVRVIEGVASDPLDDDAPNYRAYRSIRPGPPPEILDPFDDLGALADWIRAASSERRLLVLTRTNQQLEALSAQLARRGADVGRVGSGERPAQVRLCTMHRAKGLESPGVVLVKSPARRPADIESDEEWQRRRRALEYVAMTRARDWCAIVEVSS